LFLAGFATFALLYCVQPLLPFFATTFNLSATQSALSLSLATGALAVSIVATGAVFAHVSKPRVIAASLFAAAILNFIASQAWDWPTLLAARLLEGIALGGVPALAMAYLAEEVDIRRLGFAMGVYVSGTAFGGMTGRVATAVLLDFMSWRAALEVVSALGLAAAIGFAILVPLRQRTIAPSPQPNPAPSAGWGAHLTSRILLSLFAVGFFGMGAFVSIYNYATFRLTIPPYSLSQTEVGLIFLAYTFGMIASSIAGAMADRLGQKPVLIGSLLLTILGIAATAAAALPTIVFGICLFTFGFFAVHAVVSGWVGRVSGRGKSQAASLYLLAYYAGSSVLGAAGGLFWDRAGWPGMVGFTVALLGVSLALAALLTPPRRVSQAAG
jgi:YNFM family putative membrane transporter